jgi:hypothetical protein
MIKPGWEAHTCSLITRQGGARDLKALLAQSSRISQLQAQVERRHQKLRGRLIDETSGLHIYVNVCIHTSTNTYMYIHATNIHDIYTPLIHTHTHTTHRIYIHILHIPHIIIPHIYFPYTYITYMLLIHIYIFSIYMYIPHIYISHTHTYHICASHTHIIHITFILTHTHAYISKIHTACTHITCAHTTYILHTYHYKYHFWKQRSMGI